MHTSKDSMWRGILKNFAKFFATKQGRSCAMLEWFVWRYCVHMLDWSGIDWWKRGKEQHTAHTVVRVPVIFLNLQSSPVWTRVAWVENSCATNNTAILCRYYWSGYMLLVTHFPCGQLGTHVNCFSVVYILWTPSSYWYQTTSTAIRIHATLDST
jgi:hypothetical protein